MCKEWMPFFTFTKCSKTKRQHAFPSHSSIKTFSLHSLIGKKELWNNYGLCWTVHDLNKYVNENARLANHDLPWQDKNRMQLKKNTTLQSVKQSKHSHTCRWVCLCETCREPNTSPTHSILCCSSCLTIYCPPKSQLMSVDFSPMFIKKTDSKQNTSFPWWTFVTEV